MTSIGFLSTFPPTRCGKGLERSIRAGSDATPWADVGRAHQEIPGSLLAERAE